MNFKFENYYVVSLLALTLRVCSYALALTLICNYKRTKFEQKITHARFDEQYRKKMSKRMREAKENDQIEETFNAEEAPEGYVLVRKGDAALTRRVRAQTLDAGKKVVELKEWNKVG